MHVVIMCNIARLTVTKLCVFDTVKACSLLLLALRSIV